MRPLLTYLDELSFHLGDTGFEASTDLDQTASNLEAVMDNTDEQPFDVAPAERKWRTAIGYLLEAAIDRCANVPAERDAALRACVRQLDAALEEVWWVPPVRMRDAQERLARALDVQLPSIMSDYEPGVRRSFARGKGVRLRRAHL